MYFAWNVSSYCITKPIVDKVAGMDEGSVARDFLTSFASREIGSVSEMSVIGRRKVIVRDHTLTLIDPWSNLEEHDRAQLFSGVLLLMMRSLGQSKLKHHPFF